MVRDTTEGTSSCFRRKLVQINQQAKARGVLTQLLPVDGSWTYEKKREAQEILERVYLGPFDAGRREEVMRELGITHCILIRDPAEARY